MENKPFFKRVIVRKERAKKEENDFLKEKNADNTFEIFSVGDMCDEQVKSAVGKKVIISDTNAQKLNEDEQWIYYVISQEALLVY